MNLKTIFLVSIAFAASVAGQKKSYEGYKLYNVVPKSNDEVKIIEDVQSSGLGELWQDQFAVNQVVKIMVAQENQAAFLKTLNEGNIEVTEIIADLQKAINDQLLPSKIRRSESLLSLSWDQYYNLDQINAWLDELADAYPSIVSTVVIGRSFENKEIKGVIMNFNRDKEHNLVSMLEGTLHAREWITTATVTWIIKEFLTSNDPEIRTLADNFEWHIFPIVNPDGYNYTFTHNRMWRKNRSTASFKTCNTADDDMSNGVDLNRNFDFVWMSVGASNDSCTNTYAGPLPASEPETRSIVNYVNSLKERGQFIYYISFHSYTQLIIVPYSHLSNAGDVGRPSNYADMYEIAIRGSDALYKRFNTTYRVGISADVLYPMSGTSFDWVKYAADVPIVYLIELRDLGEFGFLLPAEQIVDTSLEFMDAFVEMDKTARTLGYYQSSAVSALSSILTIICSVLFAMIYS